MKTVRNTTRQPVRVPLPGGKTLHLGPGKTGQIADPAVAAPAVQRLLESRTIELVGSEDVPTGEGDSGTNAPHESTHGHPPPTVVTPRGNR